ncbi:MAG: nickel-responsive transcriptional regulator NikR [Candidatus Protistobacter heckmanni]|nr:nickel-responsive transcriptional regulator NikR [Candidatus Protistobacter heckmanni]
MERITISLDENLAQEFDALIAARGYGNRSEAMRDILRQYVERSRFEQDKVVHCVASLSYIYNHHERELAKRVTDLQHAHHEITISSMHAHLDHEHCIETLLLRGKTNDMRACAEKLLAERGIRHGALNLIPVQALAEKHSHGHGHAHGNGHSYSPLHYRPKT